MPPFTHSLAACLAACVLTPVWASATQAALEDELVDAANLAEPFGPLRVSASTDGSGSVTLTRTGATEDAGVDWLIEGQINLPLDAGSDYLELSPLGPVGEGYYVASLLFFDAQGGYLAEHVWVEDTSAADPQVLESVSAFAERHGVRGAAQYRLRLRVHPVDRVSAGFTFDRIVAADGPSEPGIDD